ncbi:MAG TPA: rhomboid family intramembrane serine protease [Polyangiaceae bacterium]|nr:rhomboid family intramembrane serine protease [Polyangiaceae bacterium]
MATGSRVCRNCGALNGPSETRCYRCGRRFPGPIQSALTTLVGGELIATRGLLLLCLVVFGLAVATDGRFPIAPELGLGTRFRVSTWARFGALFPSVVWIAPWQLLSAVFFHFSLLHIGFNMWGLLAFGRQLEQRFGPARAIVLFLAAGIFGFVVSSFWYGAAGPATGGASGGVFGQLGGIIGVIIARRLPGWKDILFQNLVYALIIGFMLRVNTAAHLGGFAMGGLLGYLFERERVRPLTTQLLGALAVIGIVASLGSVVLSMTSPLWREVRAMELLREG